MPAPSWQAATAGQSAMAVQVNQFLTAHAVTYLYQGALKASSVTTSGSAKASSSSWLAQSFTTAAGFVWVYASIAGTPVPWPLTLQTDSSGAPSGTVLSSASLPKEFLGGFAWVPVPLPATGLTPAAKYWIVGQETGDSGDNYAWAETTAGSGAATSANGTAWTAQSYGLTYQVFDQTATPPLAGTWEDSGSRWTSLSYDSSGQLSALREYTTGQTAAGYAASVRSLTWSGGLLTGVA